jgi:hypothetical protein
MEQNCDGDIFEVFTIGDSLFTLNVLYKNIKIKVFKFLFFLKLNFQLTSPKYYQVAQAKKQTHFY